MLITPANLNAMFTAFSLQYQEGYGNAEIYWRMLCTLVPSATESMTHGWLDKIPKLREWLGPRLVQNASARSRIVTNRTFELTMGVPKQKILDDQYGLYSPQASMMGEQAAKWPDDVLFTKVFAANSAAGPVCFDGKNFFAVDHPINFDRAADGTYANLLTGKALSLTNYGIAKQTMRGFKGADGRVLGCRGTLLVVPPSLEETAKTILNSQYYPRLADGASLGDGDVAMTENVWRGSADLLVVDELEDLATTDWYLLDTRKAIKPFMFQLRQAPAFTYLTNPSDPNVFWNREFIMGCEALGEADCTLPFLALKCEG